MANSPETAGCKWSAFVIIFFRVATDVMSKPFSVLCCLPCVYWCCLILDISLRISVPIIRHNCQLLFTVLCVLYAVVM